MKKIIFAAMIAVLSLTLACSSVGRVKVSTDRGFMGPDVYVATDGQTEVRYYNGRCCCVAKNVLERLAARANSGDLDWGAMEDPATRDRELADLCKAVKAETE